MSIAKYAKRAKSIRKQHPGMSWQNAMKTASKQLSGGHHKKKKSHHVSGTVGSTGAVGKTRTRTVVVAATKKRKKRSHGWLGNTGTGTTSNLKQVGKIALGVGVGVVIENLVIKPLESMVITKLPQAAKAMPLLEIIGGGLALLKGGNMVVKGAGIVLLASGVKSALKQTHFLDKIPGAIGGEYTETVMPINGALEASLAGLLKDGRKWVQTPTVGLLKNNYHNHAVHTSVVNGNYGMGDTNEEFLRLMAVPAAFRDR